jgi:phage terminase Nu1 subunit (DNA packaging protein)
MATQQSLDTSQLAKLVGTSPRWIQKLTAEGVLDRARDADGTALRGRYPLRAVTQYCDHLRALAKLDDASQQRYEASRNAKVAAEAEMAQLRLMEYKGTLHRSEHVEFVMTQMLTAFKARAIAIPSRVARLCVGKKFKEIFSLIMTEIELALRELSGYDRSRFQAESAAYMAAQGVELTSTNGQSEAIPVAP